MKRHDPKDGDRPQQIESRFTCHLFPLSESLPATSLHRAAITPRRPTGV